MKRAFAPINDIQRVFGDPVHRRIGLSVDEANIVSTQYFQRLRYIRQNGPAYLVFPTLQGTRFEHSLGVMHVADHILQELCREEKYGNDLSLCRELYRMAARDYRRWISIRPPRRSEFVRILRLAALLHDIGHLPFSHTSEAALARFLHGARPSLNMPFHEILGLELIRQTMLVRDPAIARGVLLVLISDTDLGRSIGLEGTIFQFLKEIISGEVDADRGDYLLRDGLNSGTGFGDYDIRRLLGSMRLAKDGAQLRPLVDVRGLSSVEASLFERYKLYKYVFWHHKVLIYDELANRVVGALVEESTFSRYFFRRYAGSIVNHLLELRRRLRQPIGRGGGVGSMPPLILFSGESISRPRGYYRLNIAGLVDTPSGYFDDNWLLSLLRGLSRPRLRHRRPHPFDIALDALVERLDCSLSLWKDQSEYISTMRELGELAAQDVRLQQLVEPFQPSPERIARLFRDLRNRSESPEPLWRSFEQDLYITIEERMSNDAQGVFGIVKKPGPRYFGNMLKIRLVGRGGAVESGPRISPVLDRLDRLPNEVPIYAYVIFSPGALGNLGARVLRLIRTRFLNAVVESLVDLGARVEYDGMIETLVVEEEAHGA